MAHRRVEGRHDDEHRRAHALCALLEDRKELVAAHRLVRDHQDVPLGVVGSRRHRRTHTRIGGAGA